MSRVACQAGRPVGAVAIPESALRILPAGIAAALLAAGPAGPWEEIRLRLGRPVGVVTTHGEFLLDGASRPMTARDLEECLSRASGSSLYACEEELRQGFLTLAGGHRLGICGRAVVEGGRLRTLRQVTSLNLRLARGVPGAAGRILPLLVAEGRLLGTLVFSAPGAGKTTFLRDLVRQASTGAPSAGLRPSRVAVLDERFELAGGCPPAFDLGPRTDVLSGCPRPAGVEILLRAMNPEVVVTDELGRPEDAGAVEDLLRCGVAVVASAHAGSLDQLLRRPALRPLVAGGAFGRFVLLTRSHGPGTVGGVWTGDGRPLPAGLARAG